MDCPHVPARRGLTWFVIAAIGTVAYDGLSSAAWWGDLFGAAASDQRFGTAALVGVVVLIGAGYYGASAVAARLADGGREVRAAALADGFAHALVPIALAYAFAHYCTFVAFDGQQLIHTASDPFGLGWDLFGTADWRIVSFLSPIVVWWIQLTAIVTGHVAATTLIHDRALARFGAEVALRAQYAMLVLMVALTSLGLVVSTG